MKYIHSCRNGHRWLAEGMGKSNCPGCDEPARRFTVLGGPKGRALGRPHFGVMTFKPYVEFFQQGEATVVENREQRDELCKQHNVTYDDCVGHGKDHKPPSIADSLDFDEIMQETINAPEPERPTERADDPRRDPGGLGLDEPIQDIPIRDGAGLSR